MLNSISKKDLKSGYYVKFRNEMICFVIKDCETEEYSNQEFCFISENHEYIGFADCYADDLSAIYNSEYDVMEVRMARVGYDIFKLTYDSLPIIWQRENNNYTMYRADFEIDNGARYDKHTALLLAKNKEDAWDKFNELISPLLQYDESVYEPKIEEVKVSTDSFVYIDLIKKDNETKDFIIKKIKDNNYSFETGV